MGELYRLLRHAFAPLVAWAVFNGYLPEYMQGDVTEALVLAVSILLPIVVSWWRDPKRSHPIAATRKLRGEK